MAYEYLIAEIKAAGATPPNDRPTLTYRDLIVKVLETASEHGDQVLDLPVHVIDDVPISDVFYQPAEAGTETYAPEVEALYLTHQD